MQNPTYQPPYMLKKKTRADHLVIFFHGYGANGVDLLSLAPHFEKALPNPVFVAPNAFTPLPDYHAGYQWFDLAHMDPVVMEKNCAAVREEGARLVQKIQKKWKVSPENTTLIGFSQGTMMALYCALATKDLCAQVIGYSGGLYMSTKAIMANPKNLRVMLVHGEADDVVPFRASLDAQYFLKTHSIQTEVHVHPELAHSIDLEGLQKARTFLGGITHA